jgi:hypothetical protein
MQNVIEAKSTLVSVLSRSLWSLFGKATNTVLQDLADGKVMSSSTPVGFWNIITPYRITVDVNKRQIVISKRNWYLISKEEDTYTFKSVRHVAVKNYVFGADLGIKMYSGTAIVYSISKEKAKLIKNVLLNSEWNKTDVDVIIDIDN